MYQKIKKENLLGFGMFSLILAIILGRFGGQYIFSNFFEGLFTGLSITLNLCFLVKYSKEKRVPEK